MFRYRLAIFDFDGTLFATHKAIIYSVIKTFEVMKRPAPTYDAIYRTITKGIALEDTFTRLRLEQGDEDPADSCNEWATLYREIYKTEGELKSQPFEHAREALVHITKTDADIVVLSNKGVEAINSALSKHNLSQFITLVVGDTKGMKKKPDPMVFNEVIQPKFKNINSDEILVIGDTSADLLFAKNISADSCWAKYGYGNHDECNGLGYTHNINELNEVKTIFQPNSNPRNLKI